MASQNTVARWTHSLTPASRQPITAARRTRAPASHTSTSAGLRRWGAAASRSRFLRYIVRRKLTADDLKW